MIIEGASIKDLTIQAPTVMRPTYQWKFLWDDFKKTTSDDSQLLENVFDFLRFSTP